MALVNSSADVLNQSSMQLVHTPRPDVSLSSIVAPPWQDTNDVIHTQIVNDCQENVDLASAGSSLQESDLLNVNGAFCSSNTAFMGTQLISSSSSSDLSLSATLMAVPQQQMLKLQDSIVSDRYTETEFSNQMFQAHVRTIISPSSIPAMQKVTEPSVSPAPTSVGLSTHNEGISLLSPSSMHAEVPQPVIDAPIPPSPPLIIGSSMPTSNPSQRVPSPPLLTTTVLHSSKPPPPAPPPPSLPSRRSAVQSVHYLPSSKAGSQQSEHPSVTTKAPAPPPPPPPPLSSKKLPPAPPLPPGKGPLLPRPSAGPLSNGPPPPPVSGPRFQTLSKPPPSPQQESLHNLQKLKPLHWDKVRADPSHSMVWDRLKAGSFELNEAEIAALFGTKPSTVKAVAKAPPPTKRKGILDSKKAQNIAIQLRALKASTQDICDALLEGANMKAESLDVLVKMAPTQEEEKALLGFSGDRSELDPAERFLKSVLEIPNAFQRLQAMQFRASFKDDMMLVQDVLKVLEAACVEIRENRLFLKLLEAVLKTGNRMNKGTNRGEAEAFKLDALLRLSDVKSADGKTTLLHYVAEEIIKSEGKKFLQVLNNDGNLDRSSIGNLIPSDIPKMEDDVKRKGIEVVWKLCMQLQNVKNAAGVDADVLNQNVSKLANGLTLIQHRLKTTFQEQAESSSVFATEDTFCSNMEAFSSQGESDIARLKEEVTRVFDRVKQVTAYFHGNGRETHPLRLFIIVRDFLGMLEKVCKDLARPLRMNLRG
ncbi:hypothetical protein KP509_19G002700 [Ceratopteris richardii]|uniref:Formin-like protein n=1 Tax=Ceratopteris richardii TaxID=49495 RepID=A0A8T2SKZ7_CERRI|nr:hypothetical protein KP509_19G002700 [Ceratopteris richardii]